MILGSSLYVTGNRQGMRWWLTLGTVAVAAGLGAQWVALPGGWLIGPLLAALGIGLARPGHPKVPAWAFQSAQAVIGVLLAAAFRPGVLSLIAAHWLPVLLVVAGTLGVSLGAGAALARATALDRKTAALGTLPGGASGMIALSVSLGADTRLVALMQYTRLVLVVMTASLMARFVLRPAGAPGAPVTLPPATLSPGPHPWLTDCLTALLAAAGVWFGRLLRLPAAALLGPLILGLAAVGLGRQHPAWPPGVVPAAYVVVGLYVGLLFDRDAVRAAARLLPAVLLSTLLLIASCALMGWGLSRVTHADLLTGYLATTPGGMDSITVVALGSGADVSLMLGVQMARLLAIVLAGPLLARRLQSGRG